VGRKLIRFYEGNPITQAGHDACQASPDCSGGYRFYQHIYFPQDAADPITIPANGLGYYISDGVQTTNGSSNYNGLQASLTKGETHGLSATLSYTYSHALDNSSGYESASGGNGRVNNFVPGYEYLNYGNSDYDARHRIVASYNYKIPMPGRLAAPVKTAIGGWHVTGITSLATGFPVSLYDNVSYNSLWCDAYSYFGCPDVPQQLVSKVSLSNPHSVNVRTTPYFNGASDFATEALGTFGNAHRNFFAGPGSARTDFSLIKDTHFSEERYLQLGIEGFNIFNRTNYGEPDGNVGDGAAMGTISSSAAGRLWQLRAKFYF
jgi:hypothetical protein